MVRNEDEMVEHNKLVEANRALAFKQFYQAGFLDGYQCRNKSHASDKNMWAKIHDHAKKCFFNRFEKKIKRGVNKWRKENKI